MKTTTCAGLFGLALAGCLWTVALAAQQPAGPTMEETKTWLETEGKSLMRSRKIHSDGASHVVTVTDEEVTELRLDDCTLFWRSVHSGQVTGSSGRGTNTLPLTTQSADRYLPLRGLSVSGLTVEADQLLTETAVYTVRLVMQQTPDAPVLQDQNGQSYRGANLPASTSEDGQRIANAIKRATVLCGGTTHGVF